MKEWLIKTFPFFKWLKLNLLLVYKGVGKQSYFAFIKYQTLKKVKMKKNQKKSLQRSLKSTFDRNADAQKQQKMWT